MADKTHVDLTKVKNYVKNKTYPAEILRDKGKKSNFWKSCKSISVVNGQGMYKEKRLVVFEKELL